MSSIQTYFSCRLNSHKREGRFLEVEGNALDNNKLVEGLVKNNGPTNQIFLLSTIVSSMFYESRRWSIF